MVSNTFKTAGFFIRFASSLIDFFIAGGIVMGFLFAFIVRNQTWDFREPYMFYLWIIIAIIVFVFLFIAVPYLSKGRTIGMFVTFTRIEFSNPNILRSIIVREAFFSFSWCILFALSAIVINHTMIAQFARPNQSSIDYSVLDRFRIAIVSSVSGIIIFLQLFCAAGVIARNDKLGLHDRMSQTRTIDIRKAITVMPDKLWSIPPKIIHNELVEWIDGKR